LGTPALINNGGRHYILSIDETASSIHQNLKRTILQRVSLFGDNHGKNCGMLAPGYNPPAKTAVCPRAAVPVPDNSDYST